MAINWFKKRDKSKPTEEKKEATSSEPLPEVAPQHDAITADEPLEDTQPPQHTSAESLEDIPSQTDATKDAALTAQRKGLFARLKQGLSKTRQILTTDIDELFSTKNQIDDDLLEELEELLITSDIGVQSTLDLMETIARRAAKIEGPEALKQTLKQEILALMSSPPPTKAYTHQGKPHVVMVVGVNGVGKTTTIGKLAAITVAQGKRALIAAADTFRAAAIEQLAIWAERAGADLVKHKANADPAAVAYDSMEAALARGVDTVFIDTAGRLHTKVNLMEELKKIKRTIAKKLPTAPHEILLVLDATTGQNALSQAKLFHEALDVTGLALTKLDGTAKGGIVISICQQLNIPLQYIGVGESIEDLQPFDAEQFVDALF